MRLPIAVTGVLCAATAAVFALPTTASAEDGNTVTTIVTTTNPPTCAGAITAGVGHYPGEAALGLSGQLYGVDPCSVDITFTFTRRGDGLVQTYTRTLNGPGAVGTSKDIVGPGIGVWDVTVSSSGGAVGAEPLTIDIEPYQG